MADRNVEINLIGRNRLSAATRAAANDLERLARKVDQLEKKLADIQGGKVKIKADVDANKFQTLGRRAGQVFAVAMGNAIADGTRAFGNAVRVGLLKGGPAVQAAGAILGARIAGFIGQAITAGLGLFLGPALLAAPIAFLLKKQLNAAKEQEKSLKKVEGLRKRIEATKSKDTKKRLNEELAGEMKRLAALREQAALWNRLKARAQDFMEFISAPLKIPFADALEAVGDGLDRLKGPVREIMATLGPALAPFTKGVMDGLLAFFKALEPALPGIVAGMRAWAKEMPKIGTALGDMISKIMSDPDRVVTAVQQVSSAIQGLASFSGAVVRELTDLGNAFRTLDTAVEAFDTGKLENLPEIGLGLAGSLHTATQALLQEKVAWLRHLDDIISAFNDSPLGGGLIWNSAGKKIHEARVKAEEELGAFNRTVVASRTAAAKKPLIIKAKADITKAENNLARLKAKLKDPTLTKEQKVRIQAKIDQAEAKIKKLRLRLAALRAEKTVPKINAKISDAEAKVKRLRKKLKETHDSKTRAEIKGKIDDALAKIARLKAQLKSIRDEQVNINVVTTRRTIVTGPVKMGRGRDVANAGLSWASLEGGSMDRTGGPSQVNVAAPVVDTRVFLDSREIRSVARSTVLDENRRAAYRARVGRR